MINRFKSGLLGAALFLCLAPAGWGAANGFLGDWALTIPGGAAGWLGVSEKGGQLKASLQRFRTAIRIGQCSRNLIFFRRPIPRVSRLSLLMRGEN